MFKHRMEIVHNHDNDHLYWLFHHNICHLRESTSIISSGKVEMFLCAACHAFTPHVNAWKR